MPGPAMFPTIKLGRYRPLEFADFDTMRRCVEQMPETLNVIVSWLLDDADHPDHEPGEPATFRLITFQPRNSVAAEFYTTRYARAEVEAWLAGYMRARVERWFGWSPAATGLPRPCADGGVSAQDVAAAYLYPHSATPDTVRELSREVEAHRRALRSNRADAPAGFVVGSEDAGRVRIVVDSEVAYGDLDSHPTVGEAYSALAAVTPEDPETRFRVYALHEVTE
ncbi:hypothetical protein ACWESM_18670 [Nocardia sp. NPDC003999]